MASALLVTISRKDHVKNTTSHEKTGPNRSLTSTLTSISPATETKTPGTTIGAKDKKRQRLIPLTSDIIRAMMDFNATHSSTSVSTPTPDKSFYNTFSITSLVREEVQSILHELSVAEKFIRKEELDALIERCVRDKIEAAKNDDKAIPGVNDTERVRPPQEIEVTVEMLNDADKTKLIVENIQILEQRITNLEERISTMLQTIPKLRYLQSHKFKINTRVIREELQQFMDKMDSAQPEKTDEVPAPQPNRVATTKAVEEYVANPYDDLYYTQRQNALNKLNYRKSAATMQLNDRPSLNPYIKPLVMDNPEFSAKMKAKFLCNHV